MASSSTRRDMIVGIDKSDDKGGEGFKISIVPY